MCDVSKLLHIILFADDKFFFYSASNIDDLTNVVTKTNTTLRLLSLTVKGINTWNNLANEITQLPSLTQLKKTFKMTLLTAYL